MVTDFWLDTWVDGGTFYPWVVQRSKFSEGWMRKGEFCLEILNLMCCGSLGSRQLSISTAQERYWVGYAIWFK